MLRKSREYDCPVLQERMELLQQAHQVRMELLHLGWVVLSTWDLVLSTECWCGYEESWELEAVSESKINSCCLRLHSEAGWWFLNELIWRKLAVQNHCVILLFLQQLCHEIIPFEFHGTWSYPFSWGRDSLGLFPGQRSCCFSPQSITKPDGIIRRGWKGSRAFLFIPRINSSSNNKAWKPPLIYWHLL